MTKFAKGLLKWFLCCASLCILYCIFGEVGILFAVGFSYVVIAYL